MKDHDQDHPSREKSKVLTDRRLLERFCISRDEQAFRELVERYSRLVLGVCSRVLRNEQDAEEAFQATFMVLAAKATNLRIHSSLGAWLHRVAYHTAVRAAQKRSRHRCESLAEEVIVIDDVMKNVTDAYRQQVLDEELNQLPKKYREPLVLHYLLGKTNKEVAVALDVSERTVEGRQRRGKRLLHRRLVLRKVSLPLAIAAIATSGSAVSAASLQRLIETTVQASLAFATNPAAATGFIQPTHLAQKEVLAMSHLSTPITSIVAAVALVSVAISLAGAEAPGHSANASAPLVPLSSVQIAVDTSESILDAEVVPASNQQRSSMPKNVDSKPGKANLQSFDLTKNSKARQYIESQLDSDLIAPLQIIDEPLFEVLHGLADDFAIPILIDHAALEELAISSETEVTIDLSEVKLRSALNWLLRQHGLTDLTYIIQDEVLLITTKERANEFLKTLVYDVRTFSWGARIDKVIQATIAPDSWQHNGTGEGALQILKPGVLVIAQTQRVHQKIEELFFQLQRVEKSADP